MTDTKKDRFEDLHSFAENDPPKFPEVSREMLQIYHNQKDTIEKLLKDNTQLKEENQISENMLKLSDWKEEDE